MTTAALRLEGKVALVTGGASGIGEATARLLALHGACVVVADVNDELGRAVALSIGGEEGERRCAYTHCDVRAEADVEAAVGHAVAAFGRLDVVFSNAGVVGRGGPGGVMELSLEDVDDTMAVNVRGAFAAVKHGARAMVAAGARGSIVCTASITAARGGPTQAAYAASKHAVLGLVRSAAGELGMHGIRVNCVSPAAVATPMLCSLFGMGAEEVERYFAGSSCLEGRVLRARDVAEAVLFLSSDESGFITGHDLVVDGGQTAVLGHSSSQTAAK